MTYIYRTRQRKNTIRLAALGGALIWLALAAGPAVANDKVGKVAGTIVDAETGDPLFGATVMLEGTKLGAAADMDGEFAIANVPPGTYVAIASFIGYARQRVPDLVVQGGQVATINLAMPVETIENDTVSERSPAGARSKPRGECYEGVIAVAV
jgi:hypothetical protein